MAPRGPGGRLLLASLRWAGGRGPDLAPLAREVRRWPAVLESAGRWGVAETLAHAVVAGGALGDLPGDVARRLRDAHEAGAASNAALLAEAVRLQALLDRAGIPSVALKGTALVAAHYPLPGARHVGDLDLLVPAARLDEAAAVLAPGTRPEPPLRDHDGNDATFPSHRPAIRTAAGVTVELHFAVPGDASGEVAARVLASPRAVAAPGGRLVIPGAAACAAVACLHAFGGHPTSPVHLPRLVADLEAIDATAGLDWAAIEAAAGPDGPAHVAAGRTLLADARAGDVAAVFPGSLHRLGSDLALPLVRRGAAGPRAILRTFFPSRRFMASRYGVPERSPRMLLYYLARPFLAVRDRLRG